MPCPWRSNRGLTLAEVLLIMTLILITTGLMAGLVREYSAILRTGRGTTRTLEAAQVGLVRASGELAQAVEVLTPGPSGTTPTTSLVFERINPNPALLSSRLPDLNTVSPPANWNPTAASYRIRVSYQLSGEEWLRTVTGSNQIIANGLTGFSAANSGEGSVLLSVSIQEARRIRTISTQVFMPTRFAP